MQKKQNMTMGKSKKARKHSIGQRLVAGLLCICLSLLSLPIDDYGNFVLAAEGREVVMFPALPSSTTRSRHLRRFRWVSRKKSWTFLKQ